MNRKPPSPFSRPNLNRLLEATRANPTGRNQALVNVLAQERRIARRGPFTGGPRYGGPNNGRPPVAGRNPKPIIPAREGRNYL